MLKIIYFLKGYLWIRVSSGSSERFMNLCSNKNILLWNIKKLNNCYTMCISLKSFWQLKDIVKKSGTRVEILKRIGLPFFVSKIKKRSIYAITIIVLFIIVIFLQSRIWSISYVGNNKISQGDISSILQEENIKIGTPKRQIDLEELEKTLRDSFNEITWTTVYITGTTLMVQIKENDKLILIEDDSSINSSKLENAQSTQHMCASTDGVIYEILTRSGTPISQKGNLVKKGDVLVEGYIDIFDNDGNIIRRESVDVDADIKIKTSISKMFSTDVKKVLKQKTGRVKKYYYVKYNEQFHLIEFFPTSYEYYDITIVPLTQAEFVEIGHVNIIEQKLCTVDKSDRDIEIELYNQLNQYLVTLEQKGVQIVGKNVTIKKNMDNYVMNTKLQLIGPFIYKKNASIAIDLESENE